MTPVARTVAVVTLIIVAMSSVIFAVAAGATTASGTRYGSQAVSLHVRSQSPLTTAWTSANCALNADNYEQSTGGEIELTQSMNGDLSGCFRVPSLRTTNLVVGLQAYANRTVPSSSQVITDVSTSPSDGHFTFSSSSYDVMPGQSLTLTGHYAGHRPSQILGNPDLCWDGCQTGLREQSFPLHWTSRSTFQVKFQVPDDAWFQEEGKREVVHPLTGGNYSVGIECVTVSSGCALLPADAQVVVHLSAPASARCSVAAKCAYLTFSSNAGQAGDVIAVRGWAPLSSIIGTPFGLSMTVTRAVRNQSFAALSVAKPSVDAFNLVFARHAFTVRPDESWSELSPIHTLRSTWSGVSWVNPESGSHRIAWCRSASIEVTGGPRVERISTAGVPLALRGTNLKSVGPLQPNPQCASVTLDPHRSSTIYADFYYSIDGEAPPEYLAGMYSLDAGVTWRVVPAPPGLNVDDFAGFTTDANGVAAMFASPYANNDGVDARVTIRAEVTANGARTWTPSTLGCPAVGPCVTFGTYATGNCAMNGTNQPFLIGSPSSPADVRWSSTSWVTLVDTCFSQQLVASSARDVLLLDPSSPYPLLRSVDGGTTWVNIDLPTIKDSTLGTDDPSDDNSLLLTPGGTLFASLTNPAGTKQALYRLAPGAKSWCVVPKVFGAFESTGTAGPLRASGNDVVWMQSTNDTSTGSNLAPTLHVRSVASLRC